MSKTSIYLGIDLLDFTGPLNVKRQVNDYRDTDIGSAAKSYTLDIPLTPDNALLLKFINDIRSREEVTDEAKIVIDNSEVLRGKFRVLSLNSQFVKAIVEADDWIDDVKGISIRDLSWVGGDDHTFTAANVENSWSAGAGAFYRYPLINYTELYSEDFGSTGSKMYPWDFYAMWNIEDIVTKIFAESGYTVAGGSFFSGALGQSLYINSAPVPRDQDFIAGKAMKAYVNANSDNLANITHIVITTDTVTLTKDPVVIDTEDEDEGGDFNTGTYKYTTPVDGVYRFQATLAFRCSHNDLPAKFNALDQDLDWSIRKNAGTEIVSETFTGESDLFDSLSSFDLDSGWVYLEAGDTVYVYINAVSEAFHYGIGDQSVDLFIEAGINASFFQITWDERNLWPGIGETMSPTTHLPDVDTVDFLQGLKQAFNLRFWMDRPNRTIYIETANDFLGSTVVDYTNKIDYSEEISREVVASNYNKTQKFRWMPDTGDKAYSNYVKEFGIPFEKILTLTSEYLLPGTNIRQNSIFSPTVLGSMPQIGHYSDKVPKILGSEEFVSSARPYPAYRPKSWNPRLFEWKGMIALTTGEFDFHDDIEDASGTTYNTFPSVETPDMSDMYDDYWLKDFRRIDENKLIMIVLKLTPREIIPFSTVVGTAANEGFRATYKLNIEGIDMYFYMTRITTDGDRVKCEFMQKL